MTDTIVAKRSLRELRESRGLTRYQLGLELDVQPQLIYTWETKRCRPSPMNLERLCTYFHVSEEELDIPPFKAPGFPRGSRFVARNEEMNGES